MNKLLFGIKRVTYLMRNLIVGELWCRDIFVTPAQYDCLRIIMEYRHPIPRFLLVKLLGVSGPVVSRMLRALEREKYITRSRAPLNRRVVIVSLTQKGIEEIDYVDEFHKTMDGLLARIFTSSKEREAVELDLFQRYLWRARVAEKDTTPLLDPFTVAEARDFWGEWLQLPRPPPLEFATAA